MARSTSIVITGGGAFSPFGAGWQRFCAAVDLGEKALAPLGERHPPHPERLAGLITDLSPFRAAFPQARPPFPIVLSQIAMVAAHEALASAGWPSDGRPSEIGAIFNRNRGPAAVVAKSMLPVLRAGPKKMSPLLFSQSVANAPLGAVSVALGLRGPNLLTMGTGALQIAFDELRSGSAPAIVCGGWEEVEGYSLDAAYLNGFIGQPPQALATFGEGAACFVLERSADAIARGQQPWAEILAVEQALDPEIRHDAGLRGWGQVSAQGLTQCCRQALQAAQIDAAEIEVYCGGINGNPWVDAAHQGALAALGRPDLWETSPRIASQIGDTYGAAFFLNAAWVVQKLRANPRSRFGGARLGFVSHCDFHGQHVAAVIRSLPV